MTDYIQISECDDDRVAQVLSGWVGDHNRHYFRVDLHVGGIGTIFELIKGFINRLLKIPVGQQCSQSKAYKYNKKYCGN